jgi:hypothetical protein
MSIQFRRAAVRGLTALGLFIGLPLLAVAAGPPYPQSQTISGISWNLSTVLSMRKAVGSDLWPMTWAADGSLYAAWGDGGGFNGTETSKTTGRASLGFARITGTPQAGNPASFSGQNVWGQAPQFAQYQATFGGKVDDLISVGGVLYGQGGIWTAANCNCADPTIKNEDNPVRTLVWSSDLGKTWQIAPWTRSGDAGASLQFGQDYSGAWDPAHVYYYYQGDVNVDPGHLYVRRTLVSQLTANPATTSGYFEYFSGLDSNGAPIWSTTAANAASIFYDANVPYGVWANQSVVYNAPLGRYLLAASHGDYTGQIGFFESQSPWGPWSTVAYYSDWGGFNETAGEANGLSFPSKWISSDGKTLWGVFSGQDLGRNGPKDFDSFNVAQAVLLVSDAQTPQIAAPSSSAVLAPNEEVTAKGSGANLSWSVTQVSSSRAQIATGNGASITFTVPGNVQTGDLINVALSGSGGSVSRNFPVSVPVHATAGALVGYWKLDAGSGIVAADSSGEGDAGSLVDGPTWTSGPSGAALQFNGRQASVDISGSAALADLYQTGVTVSAWIRPSGEGSSAERILDKDNNSAGWFLKLEGRAIQFVADQFDTAAASRASQASVVPNAWQHVAATWDGSANGANIHLYINGAPADGAITMGVGGISEDAATPLSIGNRSVDRARGFDGAIDEVRIYKGVLTPQQIQALATSLSAAN